MGGQNVDVGPFLVEFQKHHLQSIFYHDAQYTHFVNDVCKAMLLQGYIEVGCFLLVWEEANNVTCSTASCIFSSTFDTDVYNIM